MNIDNILKLKNKKILVIGLGKSGLSVINALTKFDVYIRAIDTNISLNIQDKINLPKKNTSSKLEILLGEKINKKSKILDSIDFVIVSPGVPSENLLLKRAEILQIPVLSEIELAWSLMNSNQKSNTVAVTGTNGKTTVVALIDRMFKDCGINSIACGNIGNPLINTIEDKRKDLLRVIEVSSFQLEKSYEFNPHVAIILNITSDHLDRHKSMKKYAEAKFRLFQNATKKNLGIFNIDDSYCRKLLINKKFFSDKGLKIIRYSLSRNKDSEIFYEKNKIFYNFAGLNGNIIIEKARLKGCHNILNMMAAAAAAKIFGIDDKNIEKTIKKFKPLEHRIEFVKQINGVKIYNDSKATNPDATIKALESFEGEISLILGGKDKNMDFTVLLSIMDKKVSNLFLIGETQIKILNMLKNHSKENSGRLPYDVFVCSSLEEAVKKGLKITKKGGILLLSPACASFDMFKDYKDRGQKFKGIILNKI